MSLPLGFLKLARMINHGSLISLKIGTPINVVDAILVRRIAAMLKECRI